MKCSNVTRQFTDQRAAVMVEALYALYQGMYFTFKSKGISRVGRSGHGRTERPLSRRGGRMGLQNRADEPGNIREAAVPLQKKFHGGLVGRVHHHA